MKTPILVTERLILRPLNVADTEEIYRNWSHDPEVARFMSWSVHENIEVTREWLRETEEHLELDSAYDWGFERQSDHMLIGSGGIYYREDREMFVVGYNTMKSCWNQGYTTEAVKRILKFAVEELHQERLFSYHAKENPNSGRVMEKAGFYYAKDSGYDSMDGKTHFEAKEYLFEGKKDNGNKTI